MEKNKNLEIKKEDLNESKKIKIVDEKGYDIEQFLCRCSNKNAYDWGRD